MYYDNRRKRHRTETIDQKRRRWAREEREFNARQRQREREKEDEERELHRRLCEQWDGAWAAMSPEERAVYAKREAELAAARAARLAEAEEQTRRRAAMRNDPFSTFGT